MTKQNMNDVNDEIDLIRLVKVLIKKKWLIIGGTLIITLAAWIISLLLPKAYQSTAFFRLSSGADMNLEELKQIQDKIRDSLHNDILYNFTLTMILDETLEDVEMMKRNVSFPDYKKYSAQFTNPYRFNRFLEQKKQAGDKEARELNNSSGVSLTQCIEPVYAFSKKDLKELTQNPREARNFVVGVEMKVEKETPEKARAFLNILGEYIKDSILYGRLEDYITTQRNKAGEEYKKFENTMIKDEFKLRQLTAKRIDMEQLLKKYPETKSMMNRELLSLDKNGYRYLSPAAQMVGIESHIADIKENLTQNQRSKQLEDLKYNFFSSVKEMMTNEKEMFGYLTLNKITQLLHSVDDKKFPDHIAQEVKNELAIDFAKLMNIYEEMQFLAGPSLPHTPIKPKKNLILAVGFILGVLMSVFLAFTIEWWTVNKQKVVTV